jgi:hypothetical protein
MMFCKLPALFGAIAFYLALVHAHPIWNIFNTRNSIDTFVTGSSPLLAGIKFGATHYLTTPRPPGTSALLRDALSSHTRHAGSTGDLTVSLLSSQDDAPLFFVHSDKLFHYTNDSYIFHVNVLNVTGNTNEPLPYQLALSERHDGLLDAMWRWRGAFLHLDYGQKTTNGLYYMCVSGDGKEGVYTSFDLL